MPDCSFCSLLDAYDHAARISEFENSVAFLTRDQSHPGRCVLILKSHLEHFHELSETHFETFNREMRLLDDALRRTFQPDRINYAVLGNVVAHVHWHLIPRYRADSDWGAPPWPAQEGRTLPVEGYQEMAERIRRTLGPFAG